MKNRFCAIVTAILLCATTLAACGETGSKGDTGATGDTGPAGPTMPVIQSLSADGLPSAPGGTVKLEVVAQSAEGLDLTYSWSVTGAGWSIQSGGTTGTVTLIAPDSYGATGSAAVTVLDSSERSAMGIIALSTERNGAPVIQSISTSPSLVAGGGVMTIHASATDPDNDALAYAWTVPAGWTIQSGQGTASLTVTAPDERGNSGTVSLAVDDGYTTVNGSIGVSTAGNGLPAIQSVTATPNPVAGGGVMTVQVSAADPDNDALAYAWTVPAGWTIQSGQGTASLTVAAPDERGNSGTVSLAVDDGYTTVNGSIGVSTAANSQPDIQSISIYPQPVLTSANLVCSATDENDDPLSYSWTVGGIAGIASGSSAWWTSPGIPGYYTVSVAVSDGTTTVSGNSFSNMQVNSTSPWPKFRRDIQGTGYSPLVTTAATGTLKWSYATGGRVYSSPAIGADGTVYVGSTDTNLYAINADGTLKWNYATGAGVYSSPAIGADGTVYVGSTDTNLYAINADGTLKWSYATGGDVESSPAIGADGTVYVGADDYKLYAINSDGTLKWSYQTTGAWLTDSSPAIGADGTVYVWCMENSDPEVATTSALNPDGTLKWSYTSKGNWYADFSPAVGADGTVYVGSADLSSLCALNPDGTLKTCYAGYSVFSSPAIGADGTVYVGSNESLYAFNADGTVKWSYATGAGVYSSPAIGADGTVYVGSSDTNLYAINADGTLKWSYATGAGVYSSPAIGADGTVYVGSDDGSLYAIK